MPDQCAENAQAMQRQFSNGELSELNGYGDQCFGIPEDTAV